MTDVEATNQQNDKDTPDKKKKKEMMMRKKKKKKYKTNLSYLNTLNVPISNLVRKIRVSVLTS